MKSPFPGMDPFIEACGLWEDFHDALIQEIKHGLNQDLPDRYVARTSDRAYVVLANADGETDHRFKPDVAIASVREESGENAGIAVIEAIGTQEPISMRALVSEEFRESFVEIREVGSDKVVTYVEVLSPSNKKPNSEGWSVYLRKRQGILLGRASNLIELDLVRSGQRMPMADLWPASPYAMLIARMNQPLLTCQVYPAYSTESLPSIPVPLLKPDADTTLKLQPMMEAIYTRDRYRRSIDYTWPVTPPLTASEAAFLKS